MGKVLLTGGLGYVGSHVVVELAEKGYEMILIDDLSNSEITVLKRLQELAGKDIPFEQGDIRDSNFLKRILSSYDIEEIIHFAAKKAVGESVHEPLLYYDVNVSGILNLLKTAMNYPIKKFIFSSSCTVYGTPDELPVTEKTPFGSTPSPYGKSKQICEMILYSLSEVCTFDIVSLRYFNPVGAHSSSRIGELPRGTPNNLVPFITQTAAGLRDELKVFGGDYETPDGTAIRDYIHVVDLAEAHVRSLEADLGNFIALNIGTGKGYSVLEVVNTFRKVTGFDLPFTVVEKREGDIPIIYGDPSVANTNLGWKAKMGLQEMLRDAWNWQKSL